MLVDGERIVAVLAPGSQLLGTDLTASVDTVIDATGKYVIPGGIDAHTHMELPFGGTAASDTFETGTRAAAWGGTTSIIDFAVQRYGERIQDGLAAWHAKAAGNCAIDYGFHQIIGGVDADALAAMPGLIDEGITSFKLFMAYPGVFYSDDAQMLKAMQVSPGHRAADDDARRERPRHRRARRAAGRRGQDRPVLPRHRPRLADGGGGDAPRDHARQPHRRPAVRRAREREAGGRADRHGARPRAERVRRDVPAVPVPLARGAARRLERGVRPLRGRQVGVLDAAALARRGAPAPMWQALRTNDLQMVSTDHCPFCMKDQKELGIGDFRKIPNGIGSVEHRMDLMYQGVVTGELTLERWVELTSTTPGAHVRPVRQEGRDRPGRRRRHRDLRPERAHVDRLRARPTT